MKIIPETRRAHYIWYLRFYWDHTSYQEYSLRPHQLPRVFTETTPVTKSIHWDHTSYQEYSLRPHQLPRVFIETTPVTKSIHWDHTSYQEYSLRPYQLTRVFTQLRFYIQLHCVIVKSSVHVKLVLLLMSPYGFTEHVWVFLSTSTKWFSRVVPKTFKRLLILFLLNIYLL